MGLFIFNWRGLIAMVIVGVPVFWTVSQLEDAGWTHAPLFCLVAIGMTLPPSLFAYATDRCDRPGILRPYWENTLQVFAKAFQGTSPDYNPDRRTALCLWPLALGPCIAFVLYLGIWIYWAITGDATTILPYLIWAAVSCLVAAIFGKLTERWRLIVIDLDRISR